MLRNLTALGLLTLSLGTPALWMRSYFTHDIVFRDDNSKTRQWSFESIAGRLGYLSGWSADCVAGPLQHVSVEVQYWRPEFYDSTVRPIQKFGFGYYRDPTVIWVYWPHWFVVLCSAALAFALKPKPRLRFSLADLLVLMTLSAVMIAGVAGLTRLAS